MTIGVLLTAHPKRIHNGMLTHAIQSVWEQTRLPDQLVVAIDLEGKGAAATKERALQSITTDFVAVLDSDDWFLPVHLEVLETCQKETDADLVYSWFETEPPGLDPFPSFFFTDPWDKDNPRHTTTTILGRTEMMQKVHYTADPDPLAQFSDEDWRMVLGMIELDATIVHVPQRTWKWRHHPENTSGLPNRR